MSISIHTNISKQFQNIEININAPERTEEVQNIEKELNNFSRKVKKIVGRLNNNFYILDINEIISFYSKDKNNYCKTSNGKFKIKEQLYYLEEILPKEKFIRISNSVIVNLDYVRSFNTDTIGKIIVELKDDSIEIVSKRKNREILKLLKDVK